MKIIAVEDEPLLADSIEVLIEMMGYTLTSISDNSEDFLQNWETEQPDLALLDINIKGKLNGIEVAQVISNSSHPIPIIFLTSLQDRETFEQAKQLQPYAFMLKPFDKVTLQRTIELAVMRNVGKTGRDDTQGWQENLLTTDHIYVKVGNTLKKIPTKEILYVSVDRKYSTIQTAQASFVVRMSLQEVADELREDRFIQVHRSYMVNLEAIREVKLKDQNLRMNNEDEVPFSKTYRNAVLSSLKLLQ